ncbi:MAG: hypothetical protein WC438_04265 [Candidatus Pacearchaeota archaeon]
MVQTNYPTLESYYGCSLCHEPVSNPICPSCITAQIEAWLTIYPNYHQLRAKLMPKVNKFLRKNLEYGAMCIKCNEKRASVCPYCFTEFVLNELREMNVNKTVLKEFLIFFNFDLEHKGYYKEAEELGEIE